jgi:hypothetical protein
LIAATGGTRRQRSGAISPRRAASCERQVVDRGGEDVGDLLRDQLLGRGHADVDRLGKRADRRDVFSPSAVCASSQITSWYASRSRSPTWRANHAYVWIVSGFAARGSLPARIASCEPVAVALGRQLAVNWSTSRRRCVRIRTPSVRAASTKPAAAIVLPDAVGWRKR